MSQQAGFVEGLTWLARVRRDELDRQRSQLRRGI
jgi:hypothetical protein